MHWPGATLDGQISEPRQREKPMRRVWT
jgi:hypothetical protein